MKSTRTLFSGGTPENLRLVVWSEKRRLKQKENLW
jgi:hypothetical protein